MALLSKQNREVLTNPLNLDNPIMVQVLDSPFEACYCHGAGCNHHYCILECHHIIDT